jgi:tRNA pseudouridine13 synthase
MDKLAYLYGKPASTAEFKTQAEDFCVDEELGFELTGSGEHVCLQVIKKGENTLYIAKQIAKIAGTQLRNVSYPGLKDRNAVTTQWFSVPVPIKKEIDFSTLNSDSVKLLQQTRHNRKLRTGCHSANRFTITLRNCSQVESILARINAVRQGVPNYFGAQRFGHGGHNLVLAEQLFNGQEIRDRKLRGIVISAARSHIFNRMVSERISKYGIAKTLLEEVFLLNGSNAFFEEKISLDTINRLAQGDIHLSAPLVGKGEQGITELEQQWLKPYTDWCEKLAELGLKSERRNMRLYPINFLVNDVDTDMIKLSFSLPKGCFATALLRELAICRDVSFESKEKNENLVK